MIADAFVCSAKYHTYYGHVPGCFDPQALHVTDRTAGHRDKTPTFAEQPGLHEGRQVAIQPRGPHPSDFPGWDMPRLPPV